MAKMKGITMDDRKFRNEVVAAFGSGRKPLLVQKANPTKKGFYWIKLFSTKDSWEVAQWSGEYWWTVGSESPWREVYKWTIVLPRTARRKK